MVAPAITSATDSDTLTGVACASAGDCWAVGSATRAQHAVLIEQCAGSAWVVVPGPTSVFGSGSSLKDVTCFTDTNCWAVGSSQSVTAAGRTLVEQYHGAGWTIIRGPALGVDASASLGGVTCPSDDDCWAVGRCTAPTRSMCAGSASLIELYDTVLPDGH
jgi:hypothetical protein